MYKSENSGLKKIKQMDTLQDEKHNHALQSYG